jgi:hypothetical protein
MFLFQIHPCLGCEYKFRHTSSKTILLDKPFVYLYHHWNFHLKFLALSISFAHSTNHTIPLVLCFFATTWQNIHHHQKRANNYSIHSNWMKRRHQHYYTFILLFLHNSSSSNCTFYISCARRSAPGKYNNYWLVAMCIKHFATAQIFFPLPLWWDPIGWPLTIPG